MAKNYDLATLAAAVNGRVVGDEKAIISGLCSLEKPCFGALGFVNPGHEREAMNSSASALLVKKGVTLPDYHGSLIMVEDPYLAYAKLSELFNNYPEIETGIHPTAVIGAGCELAEDVAIGPYVVLGRRVKIATGVKIGPGCYIGDEVIIGARSQLRARVTIYHQVKVGKDVLIHSGAVIGSDGFGNANAQGVWHKIYQLGSVTIGSDVEIGANTTIDRGALDDTIIGNNVRIDNLVQIAHNVEIGDHTAVAGCVGIAGSTKIGKYCMLGGHAGLNGHIKITDKVVIAGFTGVAKSITKPGVYVSAIPAVERRIWWKILTHVMNLSDFAKRLKRVEHECGVRVPRIAIWRNWWYKLMQLVKRTKKCEVDHV